MCLPPQVRHKRIEEVIGPRRNEEAMIDQGRVPNQYQYKSEPFRLRRKDFWPLHYSKKVFSMMKTLSHEADGLILQGADAPYIVGTCHELLKWKFAHLNSVDFLLRMTNEGPQLLLYCRGREETLEGTVFTQLDDSVV